MSHITNGFSSVTLQIDLGSHYKSDWATLHDYKIAMSAVQNMPNISANMLQVPLEQGGKGN